MFTTESGANGGIPSCRRVVTYLPKSVFSITGMKTPYMSFVQKNLDVLLLSNTGKIQYPGDREGEGKWACLPTCRYGRLSVTWISLAG